MIPDISLRNTIRWLPDYAVGVDEIDCEHQSLFALAEKFHVAMRAGKGQEILECILNELVDYTCRHFANEEKLMEQIRYPYYPDHCRQHQDLRLRVVEMKGRTSPGENITPMEVMQFLVNWLKCHTTTSDRRIGSYMRKYGLVP